MTTAQPTSFSSPPCPATILCALTSVHVCEKTLGRIEDHVRRCDQGLMLILAFGKNGTVGVIRSWGAIRAVHMTACLCVSPPLPSPLKTCNCLSFSYFSSQAVFMPLSSSQLLLFLIFICFSMKECKDIFFSISSTVKKKSTVMLAALRGCTQAQQRFELNGNISMLTMPMLMLRMFTI